MKPTVYSWTGPDGEALAKALAKTAALPNVGILFAGAPGNGKTTAARQHACEGAWFWDCGDSDPECRAFILGEDRYVTLGKRRNAIIDDLGAEEPWNEYGTKHEPLGEWLWGLHKRWVRGEWAGRLFVTTNLTGKEVANRYGGALLSRLLEMCVPCKFTGPSLRRIAGMPVPSHRSSQEPAGAVSAAIPADGQETPSGKLLAKGNGIVENGVAR